MTYDRVAQRQADIDILARTLWAEARGEGLVGMKAVACVILNRLKKPGWWSRHKDNIPDDTIEAVCRDPYQFSCWNKDDPNLPQLLAVTREDKAFDNAWLLAEIAVDGKLDDITNGATSYYSTTMKNPPYWAADMKEVAQWGKHKFFA